jgi:hypothetical protein
MNGMTSEGKAVAEKSENRLNRLLDRIEAKAPIGSRLLHWLRKPSSRLVRIPLGIVLILGGIFSILPGLGIWMLPLGVLLLALDVPFLQGPVTKTVLWVERTWTKWRRKRRS